MTAESGKHLSFPFRIGNDGRTAATASLEEHVRDELVQLLLTNPGERAYLPEFGGGLRRLLFENADDASVSLVKARIMQAVQEWLGNRISVKDLAVSASNGTIVVDLTYSVTGTDETKVMQFRRSGE